MEKLTKMTGATIDTRRRVGRTTSLPATTTGANSPNLSAAPISNEVSFASVIAARNLANMGYEPNEAFAQYQYSFRPAVNVTFSKEALQLYKDRFNFAEEPYFA